MRNLFKCGIISSMIKPKRRIKALLEQLRQVPDQSYFWSDEWQARIRESEADIQAGRTLRVVADDVDQALEWLNGGR